ncbi:MAG TPA: ABC transporter ATP-binding protein, partial [Oscillatoriaceae cyanobacterium]
MPTPAPSNEALVAQDLAFSYRRAPVLVGVRWSMAKGSFACVLGLSGAGKSTLLKLLAGVETPTGGSARVLGGDPRRADTRRSIGYMPQSGGLYADLSVEENLHAFGKAAGLHGGGRDEAVERALEFLGLRQRRGDLVGELPAGLQQRVSLGVALLPQPSILLLDEPLNASDPLFRAKALAHLKALAAEGRTILVATSHAALAAQCQTVGILRAGRLISEVTPNELVPPGRGRVRLTYRERTGTRQLEQPVADYRRELPALLMEGVAKPV